MIRKYRGQKSIAENAEYILIGGCAGLSDAADSNIWKKMVPMQVKGYYDANKRM